MRHLTILCLTLVALAGCTGTGPSGAPSTTAAAPTQLVVTPAQPSPTAPPTEAVTAKPTQHAQPTPDVVAEYIASRNAICGDASLDVADINAQYIDAPGATRAMVLEGLSKVRTRAALAHEELAQLSVPPVFQAFVDAEIAARENPVAIAAYEELVRAIERGDDIDEAAAAFDAVMNPINAEREGTETAYGFVECA